MELGVTRSILLAVKVGAKLSNSNVANSMRK